MEFTQTIRPSEKIKSFEDLNVWQKAHQTALIVYKKTQDFPAHEQYGIISQIRRAAISIPANLAEGSKRLSRKDYAHFVNISESSLEELKYLLILSRDLNYLSKEEHKMLKDSLEEVGKMLFVLRKKLIQTVS